MDEPEEWAVIDEAPEFIVSNYGEVRNQFTGKTIKTSLTNNGYLKVNLSHERRYFQKPVHILVATAFVPGKEPGLTVIPLDGNKTNVYFENLMWGTRYENMDRAFKDGRIPRLRTWVVGDDGVARDEQTGEPLTRDTVFPVRKSRARIRMPLDQWLEEYDARMEARAKEREEKRNRRYGRRE